MKSDVEILGGIGPGKPWFDTTAFLPVTERRFGSAGVNSLRGPGFANVDMSLFREFQLGGGRSVQFRFEAFNLTNTAHFANPQGSVNASNFGIISGTANSGREGIDERLFRLGLRLGF